MKHYIGIHFVAVSPSPSAVPLVDKAQHACNVSPVCSWLWPVGFPGAQGLCTHCSHSNRCEWTPVPDRCMWSARRSHPLHRSRGSVLCLERPPVNQDKRLWMLFTNHLCSLQVGSVLVSMTYDLSKVCLCFELCPEDQCAIVFALLQEQRWDEHTSNCNLCTWFEFCTCDFSIHL